MFVSSWKQWAGFLTVATCLACGPGTGSESFSDESGRSPDALSARTNVPADDACSGFTASALSEGARSFMRQRGLILPGEESDLGGTESRWSAGRVVPSNGVCLVVMGNSIFINGVQDGEPYSYEVIVVKRASGGTPAFSTFESVLSVPDSLRVAIGGVEPDDIVLPDGTPARADHLPRDLYYVELRGDSALAAQKAILSGVRYYGFSGHLAGDGKLSLDPTPNRTWRVVSPEYSLRRGNGAEAHDVRPAHLDADFEGTDAGCNSQVIPWAASYLRKLHTPEGWVDLIPEPKP